VPDQFCQKKTKVKVLTFSLRKI